MTGEETRGAWIREGGAKSLRDELVWITEAIVEYKRSRGWFQKRIDDGRLHEVPQLGTNRKYLHREEIEREISKEARG